MGILLNIRFTYNFFKCWITQISLISFISGVKLLRVGDRYTENMVLNLFFNQNEKEIDRLIEAGILKITDNTNILYTEIKPSINNYPGKAILFIGGRNNITINIDFCKRLSEYLGITIFTFQYSGYYKSGIHNELSHDSYLHSINELYEFVTKTHDTYIVAYSIGCYGAYHFNKKDKIFLISPFSSLQKTIRDCIKIDNFNLSKLIKEKPISEIIIHGFHHDMINPIHHFDGHHGLKITKHFGNHVSGLSNYLFDHIKEYINSYHI